MHCSKCGEEIHEGGIMNCLEAILTEVSEAVKNAKNEYTATDMVLKAMMIVEFRRLNSGIEDLKDVLRLNQNDLRKEGA
jgi:hypothetical protein